MPPSILGRLALIVKIILAQKRIMQQNRERVRHAPVEIEKKILEIHVEHIGLDKYRISDEIARAKDWYPLGSSNTERRILEEATQWKPKAVWS